MMKPLSYQGISDEVAVEYIRKHGTIRYDDIARNLLADPECAKLASYWEFTSCGYQKALGTCDHPAHLPTCPLPAHELRNGRLNQMAYSLFLFVRDVAEGDLVRWIDQQVALAESGGALKSDVTALPVVGPLSHVYGASWKVLMMVVSQLFLGAGEVRPPWQALGVRMIPIDTLVHNFLHRTGILSRLGAAHAYG